MMRFCRLLALAAFAGSAPLALGNAEPKKDDAPAAPAFTGPTTGYVHQWNVMPSFTGTLLGAEGEKTVAPRKGRALLVIFLASWCEPCQQIMQDTMTLAKRYQRLDTDVVYVFVHDTKDDAEGFMKEFGLREAMLGNQEILKTFHNPELPTIYVADRQGWMATRFTQVGQKELAGLDDFLKTLTAL